MKDPYRRGSNIVNLESILSLDGLLQFFNRPFQPEFFIASEAESYIAYALYHQRRRLLRHYPHLVFLIDYARSPFVPVLTINEIIEIALTRGVPRNRLAWVRAVIREDKHYCAHRARRTFGSDY